MPQPSIIKHNIARPEKWTGFFVGTMRKDSTFFSLLEKRTFSPLFMGWFGAPMKTLPLRSKTGVKMSKNVHTKKGTL